MPPAAGRFVRKTASFFLTLGCIDVASALATPSTIPTDYKAEVIKRLPGSQPGDAYLAHNDVTNGCAWCGQVRGHGKTLGYVVSRERS